MRINYYICLLTMSYLFNLNKWVFNNPVSESVPTEVNVTAVAVVWGFTLLVHDACLQCNATFYPVSIKGQTVG